MNDIEIYKKAVKLLRIGENIALVTVISTTGSTPGKIGYKMLVWGKNGETFGTVGGGSIEAEMIDTAKNILPGTEVQVFKFNLDDTADDEKAICGGTIEFSVETFDKNSLGLFKEIFAAIEDGGKGALISIISPNKGPEKIILKNIYQIDKAADANFPSETIEFIKRVIEKGQAAKETLKDGGEIFIESICEQATVFIFGAGHLSYYISRFAKLLNFRVAVCDERAEFANKKRFPNADDIIVEYFEKIFDKINVNKNSYIVIVTRGHKCDEIVLERAVQTDAKYIGMIGSKSKTLTILKNLSEKGIPEEALSRVYSPIGLSIGAVTPEEIALSIVCELVKIRRLGDIAGANHMRIDFPVNLQEEDL
jgi:xanthine dehydrogenase accessory factor